MTALLTLTAADEPAAALVQRVGTVHTTYDHRTQDSGNVSWLVTSEGRELFVKSAGEPGPAPGGATPYYDHAGRCELLRNAAAVARSCDHPALARLRNLIETTTGPALVYDVAPGELLHVPAARRTDPTSPYQRFARAPAPRMLTVFTTLLDAHRALADQGWVAADLYDGCLMVDADRLTLVDLDTYHRGPFVNTMGRMFGSDRFMAPEEFILGATIDERTTVFTLGRLITHFGTRLTEDLAAFVGTAGQAEVVRRACESEPANRFPGVAAFAQAWADAG